MHHKQNQKTTAKWVEDICNIYHRQRNRKPKNEELIETEGHRDRTREEQGSSIQLIYGVGQGRVLSS